MAIHMRVAKAPLTVSPLRKNGTTRSMTQVASGAKVGTPFGSHNVTKQTKLEISCAMRRAETTGTCGRFVLHFPNGAMT